MGESAHRTVDPTSPASSGVPGEAPRRKRDIKRSQNRPDDAMRSTVTAPLCWPRDSSIFRLRYNVLRYAPRDRPFVTGAALALKPGVVI